MEQYSFKVPENCSSSKCHVMPFQMEFEGTVPNKLNAEQGEDGHWKTSFRGRDLHGQEVDFKDKIVVELEQQEDTNRYRSVQAVEKYILYEHGSKPQGADPYGSRMSELLEMAESISS